MKSSIAISLLLALSLVASAQTSPIVPDSKLTPGDALDVTVADISVPGYTKKVRNVPAAVKREVYAEYGILSHAPREYEVDHLIPLELPADGFYEWTRIGKRPHPFMINGVIHSPFSALRQPVTRFDPWD